MSAGTFQPQTERKPQILRTSQPQNLGRETDSDVLVLRGPSRVLSPPQTGYLQEFELFSSHFTAGKTEAPSRAMLPATPVLAASPLARAGNLRSLESCGGCCRAPNPPQIRAGQHPKGTGARFWVSQGLCSPAPGLQAAGGGHGSLGASVFLLVFSATHRRAPF